MLDANKPLVAVFNDGIDKEHECELIDTDFENSFGKRWVCKIRYSGSDWSCLVLADPMTGAANIYGVDTPAYTVKNKPVRVRGWIGINICDGVPLVSHQSIFDTEKECLEYWGTKEGTHIAYIDAELKAVD